MAAKKRLYFLIIPAIILYVAAVGFVIAGSAARSPSMPRRLALEAEALAPKTAGAAASSLNEIEITVEGAEKKSAAEGTSVSFRTIEGESGASAASLETPHEAAALALASTSDAGGTFAELDGDQAPLGMNGMGGADITPHPDMGIETPELSYIVYRIKAGDMIGTLAEKYGVTQDTLISVNNIKQSRTIQIGQYIRIPSIPGIVYTTKSEGETPDTIAEKYKVSAAKVAFVNHAEQADAFAAGTTLFVPDAELDWFTRQEINGDLFTRPLHSSYYISSRYSWRVNPFTGKRTFHNGTDMAAPKGTNVYAALAGVVVAAGWDNVYGNYVTVSHHSGYKTLYGHMSKISVKKGQAVSTTTKLGEVGSTGQSTGPHLHFTVYKNGRTINAETLWK